MRADTTSCSWRRRPGQRGRMCQGSPAGALGLKAELAQLCHQAVAMIALDLDHPVLERAACAAKFLQPGCELLEVRLIPRNAADHGDALAAAPCDFAPHTHPSGARSHGGRGFMSARTGALERRTAQHYAAVGRSGF